ncbi:MAG: hypothetical protein Q7T55_04040, partial [Solirubrobacteraceae bacterium]|nr:hypothetical protein [Solirubrobacteraceae bacterium]
MRALRTLLAVALVAAAPVAVAGCGGKSAEEQAAEKANDTVPATSIQDRNAALDARDEKSAKILEKEQQKGVGAVKEAKEVVDGAIDDTVGTATAEAKARAERAQDGAKDAADA